MTLTEGCVLGRCLTFAMHLRYDVPSLLDHSGRHRTAHNAKRVDSI